MFRRTKTFYGWRVVAAAFILAVFGWGFGFYGPPIFLEAVRNTRDWSLSLISTAVTVHFLVGSLVVANLPRLHAAFGVPRVTKVGIVLLAAGVCGWAAATAPWQLLAATVVSGSGWAAMGAAMVNAVVSPWFVRDRPAALSMAYNGASIGGVLFSPLWVVAIGRFGFPGAAVTIGVFVVAVTWLLADWVLSRHPGEIADASETRAGGSVRASLASAPPLPGPLLWRNVRFVTLSAAMAIGLFAQIGLIAHLYSLLVPALGGQQAGLAMGLATGAAIVGRMLAGWLMPANADRRLVSCLSYAVQIVGVAAFIGAAGRSVPLLYLGVILFGAGIGNATSLPPLIAQTEFAREDVSRVVALIVAISQASYAFAPAAFGAIRDLAPMANTAPGEAPLVFALAVLLQAVAIGSFLAGKNRLVRVPA